MKAEPETPFWFLTPVIVIPYTDRLPPGLTVNNENVDGAHFMIRSVEPRPYIESVPDVEADAILSRL